MKRISLLAWFITALSVASHSMARADTIGVRFGQGQPGLGAVLDPGVSAGVVPQFRWNSVNGMNGTSGPLTDNNGAVTATTVQWSAASGSVFAAQSAGGDEALNNAAIAGNPRVTISNIPYARYDLNVYALGAGGAGSQIQIALQGGNSYYGVSPNPGAPGYLDNNAATPYAYAQAASTNPNAPTINGNYAVFTNLTGATQTVLGGPQTAITAVQIVQSGTAAPGTYAAGTLTLLVTPSTFASNGGPNAATGTVSRPDTNGILVVNLLSGDTSLARVPATVTIPAGANAVSFAIASVPDNVVRGARQLHIEASANGYKPARVQLHVTDADTSRLRLSVHPRRFSEAAGPNAATGEVTRNDVADAAAQPLVVSLTSADPTAVRVPPTVTIPAGQQNVTFPLSAVTNATRRPGGLTTVQITASATGFPTVTDVVVVTDAAGAVGPAATTTATAPTLSLTVTPAKVAATAGARAATGIITRAPVTKTALIVKLSSSDTTAARVPATVTIPAEEASATFSVSAVKTPAANALVSTVHITATTPGLPTATVDLTVTH